MLSCAQLALTQLGITEIKLAPDTTHIELPDGTVITGQTTFVMGGVTRTVANNTLVVEKNGYWVDQTLAPTDRQTGNRTVVRTRYRVDWVRKIDYVGELLPIASVFATCKTLTKPRRECIADAAQAS